MMEESMAHKLEKLYTELTGIKSDDLEPKPSRKQIAAWISNIRSPLEVAQVFPDPTTIVGYRVVETDTEAPFDGIPATPFTVVERELSNGITEYAFVWGKHIDPYDSDALNKHTQASGIEWFELGQNCSL